MGVVLQKVLLTADQGGIPRIACERGTVLHPYLDDENSQNLRGLGNVGRRQVRA